jgi:hypothetical protein
MKNRGAAALVSCSILLSIPVFPDVLHACSIVCLSDGETAVVGYNFDWYKDVRGLVFINERGLPKTAFMPWDDKPAAWTSKYGSITFNGCGKDMPFTGMNEAGLVVVQAYQGDAAYPRIDERPALCELQWIQYQLDNSASVDEVIASDASVRISAHTTAPLHFLVADGSGSVAVIEFRNGRLEARRGDDLPLPLLTNTRYAESLASLVSYMDFGNDDANPASASRFIRGARMIKGYGERGDAGAVEYAFETLGYVGQQATHWSLVYDVKNLEIHYRTTANQATNVLTLGGRDFSCGAQTRMVEIEKVFDGGKIEFQEYSSELNKEVTLFFGNTMPHVPIEFWNAMAEYSDSVRCGS